MNEKGEGGGKGEEAQEQEFNNDGINKDDSHIDFSLTFDKKFTRAVEGLEPFFEKILRKISKENALIIVEYINTARREINISDGHRKSNIHTLYELSKFHLNTKNFKEMTGEEYFYI
jgi:hypothetical protein